MIIHAEEQGMVVMFTMQSTMVAGTFAGLSFILLLAAAVCMGTQYPGMWNVDVS